MKKLLSKLKERIQLFRATKIRTKIYLALLVPRRKLAWLLIGYALKNRLASIESMMDVSQAKMEDMDTLLEKEPTNMDYVQERQRWSDLYWRYYEQHLEVASFMEYLRIA